MNKEQIIQMARDAGLEIDESGDIDGKQIWYFVFDDLERFAAAIRAATKEEDAKICEEIGKPNCMQSIAESILAEGVSSECASAIRASK